MIYLSRSYKKNPITYGYTISPKYKKEIKTLNNRRFRHLNNRDYNLSTHKNSLYKRQYKDIGSWDESMYNYQVNKKILSRKNDAKGKLYKIVGK